MPLRGRLLVLARYAVRRLGQDRPKGKSMKGELTLEGLPDLMSLAEAARRTELTVPTLRKAIRDGELEAFIPRGREPLRAGPGQGYRITKEALTAWYFRGAQ